MAEDVLSRVQLLSDRELVAQVKILAQNEREATTALVAHLAVLDERGLYFGEGWGSLFTYCTQGLHLAEYAAYNRIEAARAVRKFPGLLEMLAEGAVTLATVRLLAPYLTSANYADLVPRPGTEASGRSKTLWRTSVLSLLSPRPSASCRSHAIPPHRR